MRKLHGGCWREDLDMRRLVQRSLNEGRRRWFVGPMVGAKSEYGVLRQQGARFGGCEVRIAQGFKARSKDGQSYLAVHLSPLPSFVSLSFLPCLPFSAIMPAIKHRS